MMTNVEKIVLVKAMSDETDDDVISAFLLLAEDVIYNRVDPYETCAKEDVVEKYAGVQVKIAAYYLNKRGWDFETSHSENGVGRNYESGDLPASILRELVPKARVVS